MIHRITLILASLAAIAAAQPSLTNNNLDNLTATAKDNLEALGVLTDDAGPDNAAVAAAIAEDPQTALNASASGGAGKVLQADSNGNLKLRALRLLSDTGTFVNDGGNLVLTDRQGVIWAGADGTGESLRRSRKPTIAQYHGDYWTVPTPDCHREILQRDRGNRFRILPTAGRGLQDQTENADRRHRLLIEADGALLGTSSKSADDYRHVDGRVVG
ncbi:MAG: hypothetical protein H7A48_14535 [Akkermansiaceae bacterium]|nr:hypothetical protein [Akkermansiaceae bacterium]